MFLVVFLSIVIAASPCAVFTIIMLSRLSSGCVSKGMNIRASWDKSNPV